ncbi:MAG: hypothetical protein ABFS56_15160 [Pseudomonadota bacterium]
MSNITKGLALKPYIESVEKQCKYLNQSELLKTILKIAQTVPKEQRADLLRHLPDESVVSSGKVLIDNILELREGIEARIASLDAWEEYEEEEATEYISKDQKQALEALFRQAEELFLSNQLEAAKTAFDELFKLDNFYLDIDLRQPRTRYCRCIYETVPLKQRVKALLVGMVPDQSSQISPQRLFDGNYPFLQDIIDARPGDLPNFNKFLPGWEKALANKQTDRAILLRLEAVDLMKGLKGVAALARKQQPLGYLFWIKKLLEQKAWADVASVSQKGLTALAHGEHRAAVADSLILAAKAMADLPLVLKGKKEKCLSVPSDYALLAWINEADAQEQKSEAVKEALKFFSQNKPFASSLYVKTCLMAGEINKAFGLVKDEKAYGWSSVRNPSGIVFAGILIALLKQPTFCTQKVLQRYTISDYFSYYGLSQKGSTAKKSSCLIDHMIQGIGGRKWPTSQARLWLEWAEKIGKERIEHIVSNKYRDAYVRAAEILGALGEYFILSGREEYGISLIEHYRNVQFNRFSAFRKEVDHVIASSSFLRGKGISTKQG